MLSTPLESHNFSSVFLFYLFSAFRDYDDNASSLIFSYTLFFQQRLPLYASVCATKWIVNHIFVLIRFHVFDGILSSFVLCTAYWYMENKSSVAHFEITIRRISLDLVVFPWNFYYTWLILFSIRKISSLPSFRTLQNVTCVTPISLCIKNTNNESQTIVIFTEK